MIVIRHTDCGCVIQVRQTPSERWECPHGNFFTAQPRMPAPPPGVIVIGADHDEDAGQV